MQATTAAQRQRLFLLSSFLWLLCYVAIGLLTLDPWQFNDHEAFRYVRIAVILCVAGCAMSTSLLWGVKEYLSSLNRLRG